MTPMRRKHRKLLGTAFTVLTALLVVGYVASGWACFIQLGLPHDYSATLSYGGLSVEQGLGRPLGVFIGSNYPFVKQVGGDFPYYEWKVFDYQEGDPAGPATWVTVALWPAIAGLIAARALLIWKDRSASYNRLCLGCGYDIRGCVDGRCSECGAPVPAASRTEAQT